MLSFVFLFTLSLITKAHVVLIDPGHGGHEHGAKTRGHFVNSKGKKYSRDISEKDLSLAVANRIKAFLEDKHTVYLTRSFDRAISLEDRSKMADTVKADIFISIHFNASPSSKHHGIETYYLDNKKDRAINKLERIENASLEGNDKVINQILIDLVVEKTAPQSKKLVTLVHGEIKKDIIKRYKLKDRGIKPGLFYVLALSKRPGILLEGGFISNPKELKLVYTNKYLDQYAKSVSKGIETYLSTLPQKPIDIF